MLDAVRFPGRRLKRTVRVRRSRRPEPLHRACRAPRSSGETCRLLSWSETIQISSLWWKTGRAPHADPTVRRKHNNKNKYLCGNILLCDTIYNSNVDLQAFFFLISSFQLYGCRKPWRSQLVQWFSFLFPGETLLQQKLQESNSRLYGDVGQTVRQVYGSASREVRWCVYPGTLHIKYMSILHHYYCGNTRNRLPGMADSRVMAARFWLWLFLCKVHSATAQLNASQSAIINASHSIRLILDDLKAVSEKIDIITSCQILPDINMENPNDYTAPVP